MADKVDRPSPTSRGVSRRNLFKQAGLAGAAAIVPQMAHVAIASGAPRPHAAAAARPLEALETLTATEMDILEAIVGRLIPTDENGPGALEAHAAHYIDRALAGPLRSSREAYAAGLAAANAYAASSKGAFFAKLPAKDQEEILSDLEKNIPSGFIPDAATFFNLVRAHTIQGTFCDPYYGGGNADFVGWDLVGYPGIRLAVGANEQRMKAPPAVRKSAYQAEGGHP